MTTSVENSEILASYETEALLYLQLVQKQKTLKL